MSATLQQVVNLARIGLKGPNAAAWLGQQGIPLPERANTWCTTGDDEQDICVRLGASEFLLERADGNALRKLQGEIAAHIPGVYPVLREDCAFVIAGDAADDVLAQMCNVNFAALRAEAREAVMTLMIGVAVTVVPQGNAAQRRYRLWCDPTFGDYVWSSLNEVARPYLIDAKSPGGAR
jgi:sarcosine oxidase subunit gamma